MLRAQPAERPNAPIRDFQSIVHELNVHQMELEIQNEELREAQVELAQARDQYADLYEFAPFGYVTLNSEGKILEANLTAAAMLGVDRKVLVKANLSTFLSRDSADDCYRHRQAVFSSDIKKTCEIEIRGDRVTPSMIRLESIAFGPETDRRCRTALIDITDQKAAEKIIQESEMRLKQLNQSLEKRVAERTREVRLLAKAISHLGEGVLITENGLEWPESRIVFVNDAMCQISGYRADELIGQPARILPGEATDRATSDRITAELASGRPCQAEVINSRKDGPPYAAELFITPLLDAGGCRTNFVSIVRDITERKRTEEALRKNQELLEQRVKDRTHALEDANLRCEGANTAKSRFLTAASHDLRQPLQSVELYLSVLSHQLVQSEDQAIFDKIRKSLTSVNELLDALLDISRFESGTIVPDKQDISLQQLLARIITDNLPQAEEKGLELICMDAECIVHSDPVLLERVIENFVTNAVRYTDRGRITIDCRSSENTATIRVSDTGIGIAQDALEPIFDDYYQLGNPMRNRRQGLGLGLSIVKHIARLLDHRLIVRSVPGEGSAFAVEVPLGKTVDQPLELPTPITAKRSAARATQVLFVDDDVAIADAMTMLLTAARFLVHTASNGDQALAHIAAGIRPDIIVCDYRLPGHSGIEVIRRARDATVDSLPAVLLTGDTSLRDISPDNLANCAVLHKPVASDELISLIQNLTAG